MKKLLSIAGLITLLLFLLPSLNYAQDKEGTLNNYTLTFYPESYDSAKEYKAFIRNITEAEYFIYDDKSYSIKISSQYILQENIVAGKLQKIGVPLKEMLTSKQ